MSSMLVIPSMVVKIGDFKSIGKWVRIEKKKAVCF